MNKNQENAITSRKNHHNYSHNILSRLKKKRIQTKTVRQLNEIKIIVFSLLLIIFFFSFINTGSEKIQAQRNYEKKFISLEIKSGDCLWFYAQKYAHPDFYKSKQEYIEEVCLLNGLSSSKIYAGKTIALPVIQME